MKNIIIYLEYLGHDKNKNAVDALFVWILVNKQTVFMNNYYLEAHTADF